jgi:hypothetical protein
MAHKSATGQHCEGVLILLPSHQKLRELGREKFLKELGESVSPSITIKVSTHLFHGCGPLVVWGDVHIAPVRFTVVRQIDCETGAPI